MSQVTFAVPGVSCDHCKTTIESRVSQVPGVQHVEVNVATKQVAVEADVPRQVVVSAIEDAGYAVAGEAG